MIECPSCALPVDRDSTECPYCGYELPPEKTSGRFFALLFILLFLLPVLGGLLFFL